MNLQAPPENRQAPSAPGQRLPESARRELSPEAAQRIRSLAERYPDRLAATLPALHIAQGEFGFLSLEAMKEVARTLGIPQSHVFGVATFYTMFKKEPVGKYHFQVCTNLSCALRGGAKILEALCEKAGVRLGDVSPDGLWSVEEVECLASCGSGPCLQVNQGGLDGFLDEATLDAILDACRRGERPAWGE